MAWPGLRRPSGLLGLVSGYACPFKRPLTLQGILWPCRLDSVNDTCPKGYSCLETDIGQRIAFLTASGIEQSYCCPKIPSLNLTANLSSIFENVCLYGEPYSGEICPAGYYRFPGIGMGHVCCPDPCLRHPWMLPVVQDGKCTYKEV